MKTLHFSRILTFIHIAHGRESALENHFRIPTLSNYRRGDSRAVSVVSRDRSRDVAERSEVRADYRACVHSSTSISQTARSMREGVAVASFTKIILFRVVSRSNRTLPS